MKTPQLAAKIEAHILDGRLACSTLAEAIPMFGQVSNYFPLTDGLALSRATVKLSENDQAVIISGETTIGELNAVSVEAVFREDNDVAHLGLAIALPASSRLALPGLDQLSIQAIRIRFDADDQDTVEGKLYGRVQFADRMAIPIKMEIPANRSQLFLEIDAESIPLPDFAILSALPGGADLIARLPDGFGRNGSLSLFDLGVAFDLDTKRVASITLAVANSSRWEMLPGILALQNPTVSMAIAPPSDVDPGSVEVSVNGVISIGDLQAVVAGSFGEMTSLSGTVDRLLLGQVFEALFNHLPAELPDVEITDVDVSVVSNGAFSLSGAAMVDLDRLARHAGIPLPDGLTGIEFSKLLFEAQTADGFWRWLVEMDTAIRVPMAGSDGLTVSQATFEMAQNADGHRVACTLTLNGEMQLAAGVTLRFTNVGLRFDSATNAWAVEGRVEANIFGVSQSLAIALKKQAERLTLFLSYQPSIILSDLGGAGHVMIRNLSVFTEKSVDTAGGPDRIRWGVAGQTEIRIAGLADASGQLALETGPKGTQLKLWAAAPQIPPLTLPLEIQPQPQLNLSLDQLTLTYETKPLAGSSSAYSWAVQSAARLTIENIPDLLKDYLPPETLAGTLRADGASVTVGFDVPSTLQPAFPELALTFANDVTLSLGKPQIRVTAIELEFGDRPRLLQKLRVTLPRQLNDLFGRDAGGHPNMDLFNEEFDLHLVLGTKIGLVLATSPLKPLTFYAKVGDDGLWTDWDFGPVGRISFRVPTFAHDAGRWKASGGFDRLTDLALPLAPLKFLLEQGGFPQVLTVPLPDALPLKNVDLTGDNFGREMKLLLGDQVLGRLDQNASAILDELLDAVASAIGRLPTRLQDYLQIRIPPSAIFEIGVDTAGGGCELGLRTLPGDPALNFLFPMMLGIPELMGVSLRGLSVGQKLGGSLMQVEIDGHIDRFDMVSLIAALALDRRDFANRYILEKTRFLVPTGLPVPIPLFFSHLGLDYRDILGFDLQAHWSYPDPELGVLETISLFTDLLQFFKDPDYLLHQEGFGETLGLTLTIGENFIRLPRYLGGRTLGLETPLPPLAVGDSVARFLDFLKTGNAGYAITAIPLRQADTWIRIGSQDIQFGPLVMGMSWCITTEEEFVDVLLPASRQHRSLPMDFDAAILEALPTEDGGESYQKGFIILLMGNAALGDLVGLRTEFGMAVTAQGGFETGFRMAGEIGPALLLTIGGRIQATEESTTIKGRTGLYWKDQPLIAASGGVTVSDMTLAVEIKIELTPYFSVEGLLVIGRQGLSMEGQVAWGHGADGPDQGIGASVAFSRDGMTIRFDMRLISFDAQVTVRVPGDGGNRLFGASVFIAPDVALQERFARDIASLAKSTAANSVDQIYNDLQNAIAAVDSLEISVAGLREWLPPLCDQIIASITRTINNNTRGWKRPGRTSAHNQAKPYIRRLATLRDTARSASNRDFRPRLEAALQDIVHHNRLNITVGIPSVRWKKGRWGIRYPQYYTRRVSVDRRNLMDADQLAQLREAIGWIDALPEKEGHRIETQAIYDRLPDRDKLLARIDREIEQGVDGALPQIESIGFSTALERLNLSDLEVIVHYRRGGRRLTAKTALDLADPAKGTQQLVDAFGS